MMGNLPGRLENALRLWTPRWRRAAQASSGQRPLTMTHVHFFFLIRTVWYSHYHNGYGYLLLRPRDALLLSPCSAPSRILGSSDVGHFQAAKASGSQLCRVNAYVPWVMGELHHPAPSGNLA